MMQVSVFAALDTLTAMPGVHCSPNVRYQAAAWLSIGCLVNSLLFLESLVPVQGPSYCSDGYSLWELLRGGPPAEIKWLSRILSAALWDGIRPREWDAALVERILAARNGSPSDVIANLYGYYHALDTCRIECAGKLIDLAAAQCGKSLSISIKQCPSRPLSLKDDTAAAPRARGNGWSRSSLVRWKNRRAFVAKPPFCWPKAVASKHPRRFKQRWRRCPDRQTPAAPLQKQTG
jgi:hypothetical protein